VRAAVAVNWKIDRAELGIRPIYSHVICSGQHCYHVCETKGFNVSYYMSKMFNENRSLIF